MHGSSDARVPITVILLLNVMKHGAVVQRSQQPDPSPLVHVTCRYVGAGVGSPGTYVGDSVGVEVCLYVGNIVGIGVGVSGKYDGASVGDGVGHDAVVGRA